MRFTNKIVVITGGGGEIGCATAERFAREGATAVIVDLNRELAESAAAEIKAAGGAAWAYETNVARRDQEIGHAARHHRSLCDSRSSRSDGRRRHRAARQD